MRPIEAAIVVVGGILLGAVIVAAISAIPALIAFLAWNALVPAAFHGPHLSFLQCFAAVVLLGVVASPFRRAESKADAS